jgi:hypothetical protein
MITYSGWPFLFALITTIILKRIADEMNGDR